jgi:hypothetical protein
MLMKRMMAVLAVALGVAACGSGSSSSGSAGTSGAGSTGTAGTGSAGTGAAGTGVAGTGSAGTGAAGTGAAGTGAAGTGAAGTGAPHDAGPDVVPAGDGDAGAVATPYPLRYEQTFDSPTSLADMVFANPTGWIHEVVDGKGAIATTGGGYGPPQASPTRIGLIAVRQFRSFVLEAELMQTGTDYGHRDMCVFFGFQDPKHFYYAHIATAPDAVSHQIHIVNNAPRTAITTMRSTGFDWGRNAWKKIRVVRDVDSGKIEIYGPDDPAKPIMTASDKTFGAGYIGFGSFDDTGRVRNVKVWADAVVEQKPTFFTAKP